MKSCLSAAKDPKYTFTSAVSTYGSIGFLWSLVSHSTNILHYRKSPETDNF